MSDQKFPASQGRANGPLPMPVAPVRLAQPEVVADEAIARRAYEMFVARGQTHGRDAEDWAAAKTQLMAEASRSPKN